MKMTPGVLFDLSDKTALVTGGATGIGRMATTGLMAAGARVLIASRKGEACVAVSTALNSLGLSGTAEGFGGDVSSETGIAALCQEVAQRTDKLDILINNAGIGLDAIRGDHAVNPILPWEPTPEHLHTFFAVHAIAPLRLAASVLPTMREQGTGRIITVTTSLTTMTHKSLIAYGAPKAASEAYTAGLAMELAQEDEDSGITVNVLVPGGPADTPLIPDHPGLDRATLIQPKVMAAPVVWLVSDLSAGVTARRFIGNDWDPAAPLEEAIASAGAPIGWNG